MKSSSACIVAVSVAMICALSCSHGTQASAPTPVLSAPYVPAVSVDEAVMAITNARCDREISCDNVGSQRIFADRDACAYELGHNVLANLHPERCGHGVDQAKLSACVSVARNERCRDMGDSVSRVVSCSPQELCIH